MTFPITLTEFKTPTLVIFGCAFSVTVPAVSTCALTLAKLASSSASATVPVALAKMYGTVINYPSILF